MATTASPISARHWSPLTRPRRAAAVVARSVAPIHHFTVDVEEYFQVSAFEGVVARSEWWRQPTRVAPTIDRLLGLLAEAHARGTFFVLGWLASQQPELVHRIADAGHEIASHGWDHRRVNEQTPFEFRRSVRHTKCLLEDLAGDEVLGFRAPSFSIVRGHEWALDILIQEGHRYDSSLFPARRPGLLRQCERRHAPGTFYIHPWELDPDQPRFDVPWLTRLRHYGGLDRTEARLRRLLAEFRFGAIADTLCAW